MEVNRRNVSDHQSERDHPIFVFYSFSLYDIGRGGVRGNIFDIGLNHLFVCYYDALTFHILEQRTLGDRAFDHALGIFLRNNRRTDVDIFHRNTECQYD